MTGKLRARISTADSPRPDFKHKVTLSEKIIEQDGKRFRVETLNGKEFKLPLGPSGRVSWRSMTQDQRIDYAVAYCTEYKCWIKHIGHLRHSLTPEEINEIRTRLGIPTEKTEILNGIVFKLPLTSRETVSWNNMPEKDQVNYSIAFCIHHHCSVVKLPGGLVNVICNNKELRRRVEEGISLKKSKTVILNGEQFELPLRVDGNAILWRNLDPKERIRYAIAYCRENNCTIGNNLPRQLLSLLKETGDIKEVEKALGIIKERVDLLNEKKFVLPIHGGDVVWESLGPEGRIEYAVAYCIEHKCSFSKLPGGLKRKLIEKASEREEVEKRLGIKKSKTETWNGETFELSLDGYGRVMWSTLPPVEQIRYAIAFCIEKECIPYWVPRGLSVILQSNPDQLRRVEEGIKLNTQQTVELGGKVFILPLKTRDGSVYWSKMPEGERRAYALAFCLENNCSISGLPQGLQDNLTPAQIEYIRQELSKSKEFDQLSNLANVMEEFQ